MTPTETDLLNTIISVLSFLIIAIGLPLTVWQINLLVKTHRDNHEWERRKLTQEVLIDFGLQTTEMSLVLSKILYAHPKQPYDLQAILKLFEAEPQLRLECHQLLNFYEGLARGLKFGIYEPKIIKNARKPPMQTAFIVFSKYIEYWRNDHGLQSWEEFEHLVKSWSVPESGEPPIATPDKRDS